MANLRLRCQPCQHRCAIGGETLATWFYGLPDNARFGPVVIDLGVDQQWSPAAKRAHCRQAIWPVHPLQQRRVRLLGQFRMPVRLGVSDALVQQPGIQVVESFEPQRGAKKRSRASPTWFST